MLFFKRDVLKWKNLGKTVKKTYYSGTFWVSAVHTWSQTFFCWNVTAEIFSGDIFEFFKCPFPCRNWLVSKNIYTCMFVCRERVKAFAECPVKNASLFLRTPLGKPQKSSFNGLGGGLKGRKKIYLKKKVPMAIKLQGEGGGERPKWNGHLKIIFIRPP